MTKGSDEGSGDPRGEREEWTGNRESFDRLFRSTYASLCSFAYRFLGDRDAAEEVVQEVFLRLWKRRQELKLHTTVEAYLFRAVRNRCLNRIDRAKTRERHAAKETVSATRARQEPRDYEEEWGRELEIAALRDAIATLPERQRTVVELRWMRMLSHREIAEVLGISIKGVEISITRALKSLRGALRGDDP